MISCLLLLKHLHSLCAFLSNATRPVMIAQGITDNVMLQAPLWNCIATAVLKQEEPSSSVILFQGNK